MVDARVRMVLVDAATPEDDFFPITTYLTAESAREQGYVIPQCPMFRSSGGPRKFLFHFAASKDTKLRNNVDESRTALRYRVIGI
jgi:hypothetical protein